MRDSYAVSGWTLGGWGLLLATSFVAGCTTFQSGSDSSRANQTSVRAMQHPLLVGIPLPAGFDLVEKESVHSSSGSLRVAKCVFKGGMRPSEVVKFYKEQMAAGNWNLRSESFDQGVYDQRYESDREECFVRIGHSGLGTRVTLDVKPKPVGVPEAGKRSGQPSPTP